MSEVLRCRRVVLPATDGGLRIAPAVLRLRDGRILEIVEGIDLPRGWPRPTELGDRLLTPAFIDSHTHLALVGLRGAAIEAHASGNMVEELFFKIEQRMTEDDVAALVRVGAYECMLHGTAVVWDHYYYPAGVARGLRQAGLAGVVAPTLQDHPSGPGAAHWEENLEATATLATSHHRPGMLATAVGPHATDTVSDELWVRIIEAAERLGLPVHMHVAQTIEEVQRAVGRGDATPMALLDRVGLLEADVRCLFVHNLFVTDTDLTRLDPAKHTLAVCPWSQAQFGFLAHVPGWQAAGLDWVVATDCAASNDSMNLQKELRAVAGLRAGGLASSPEAARWRATDSLAAAEALSAQRVRHWEGRALLGDPAHLLSRVWSVPGGLHPHMKCGVIAPGALAHLAVWELDHPSFWPAADPLRALAYSDTTGALSGLMIGGRWRSRLGDHHSSLLAQGWRDARREARDRLKHLLK